MDNSSNNESKNKKPKRSSRAKKSTDKKSDKKIIPKRKKISTDEKSSIEKPTESSIHPNVDTQRQTPTELKKSDGLPSQTYPNTKGPTKLNPLFS